MTPDEKALLAMCRPEVAIQCYVAPFRSSKSGPDGDNPAIWAAVQCQGNGWLEHVRSQEPDQEVFRITPAGAAALAENQ